MRIKLWIAAVALLSTSACNYTVGECWPASQGIGDSTVAGGPIVPGGVGGGSVGDNPSGATGGGTRFPEADCNSKPKEPAAPGTSAGNQEDQCTAAAGTEWGSASNDSTYTFCSGPCAAKCSVGSIGYFSASDFDFVTTIADNGTDKGGGWQEANAKLEMRRWSRLLPESWECNVKVGMPLRSNKDGKISPGLAAIISAQVATDAAIFINQTSPDLPPGIFCVKFKETMKIMIKKVVAGAEVYTQ